MIPHDNITEFIDNKAWWVVDAKCAHRGDNKLSSERFVSDLDRPCGIQNCRGGEVQYPEWEGQTQTCSNCNGIGRHAFWIEVENATLAAADCDTCFEDRRTDLHKSERHGQYHPIRHHVSVVAGMVLHIAESYEDTRKTQRWIAWDEITQQWVIGDVGTLTPIVLPSGTRFGMWAVLLQKVS